ncbi:MAG: PorP/SprF family type IX secretion system membrane protein [Bacteroidia bacterium]
MFYKINPILLLAALLSFSSASSQDIDFNHWQANYMALNPAMTGISNNPRFHFAYRSVYAGMVRPGDANPYAQTIMASYDQRISPRGGFIGISYLNDVIDNSRLRTQAVMLNYARNYSIQLSENAGEGKFGSDGKLNLRFGISLGGFDYSIDGAALQVFNQRNPRTGTTFDADRRLPSQTLHTGFRPNFGIGTALNYNNIYGGFAIHNIIEPMVTFSANPTNRFPRRYSANVGVFLPFNPDNEKTGFMSPHFVYQRQNSITVWQPGLNINKGIVTAGASFRYKEELFSNINTTRKTRSVNFLLGISKGMFKAAYSYDYMLNSVFETPHELSLSVYLGQPREGSNKGIPYYFRKMGF